jgi:hypothetical protein
VFRTPWSERRRRSASSAFRKRSRLAWPAACSAVLLALLAAGCGGSSPEPEPQSAPRLPAGVGTLLADSAGAVADALGEGDTAGARALAAELLDRINEATDAGEIPPALAAELRGGAERLLALIPAEEPAPPPPPPPPPPKEKKPKKGKGKKDKGHEATTDTTTTDTTVTDGAG